MSRSGQNFACSVHSSSAFSVDDRPLKRKMTGASSSYSTCSKRGLAELDKRLISQAEDFLLFRRELEALYEESNDPEICGQIERSIGTVDDYMTCMFRGPGVVVPNSPTPQGSLTTLTKTLDSLKDRFTLGMQGYRIVAKGQLAASKAVMYHIDAWDHYNESQSASINSVGALPAGPFISTQQAGASNNFPEDMFNDMWNNPTASVNAGTATCNRGTNHPPGHLGSSTASIQPVFHPLGYPYQFGSQGSLWSTNQGAHPPTSQSDALPSSSLADEVTEGEEDQSSEGSEESSNGHTKV